MTKITTLAASALLVSGVAASAATLDFTTNQLVDDGFTGTFSFDGGPGVVEYTITGSPRDPRAGDGVPASAADELADAGLAGDFDGIGIRDDEVGGTEELTITFSREVKLTGAFFLDLFISAEDPNNIETAGITSETGSVFFDATNTNPENGGFGSFATALRGTVFSFFEGTGNDDIGVGDYALAGLTVAPVPLPAGVLFLGTALAGLGIAGRRKKAAKV